MIQNLPKNYFVCYTNAHLWDRSGSVLENCQGVGAKLEERKVSLSNHTERVKLFTSVKKQKSHAESSSRAVTFISASGYSGLKNWIHLALYYREVKSRVTIYKNLQVMKMRFLVWIWLQAIVDITKSHVREQAVANQSTTKPITDIHEDLY